MSTVSNAIRASVLEAAKELGIKSKVESRVAQATNLVVQSLNEWGAVEALDGAGDFGLESYGHVMPKRNRSFQIGEADPRDLVKGLHEMGMSARHIIPTAEQCLTLWDKSYNPTEIVRGGEQSDKYLPLHQVIGSANLLAQFTRQENAVGLEAFGDEINRMGTDDRLTMTLGIMRPFENIMDKNLARVQSTSPVVTLRIPSPEAWDWAKTQDANASAETRNGGNSLLRDLYRNPSAVNSQAKRITPIPANDTKSVLWATNTSYYQTAKQANVLDLSRDSTKYSYAQLDRSDLVAEGGIVDAIIVSVKSGSTTEHFRLSTRAFELARFIVNPSSRNSASRQIILDALLPISVGTTTYNGSASTIAAALTDATLKIRVRLTVTLNIGTGDLQGGGTAEVEAVALPGGTISAGTQTLVSNLVVTVPAYSVELYFDEENQRKANLSVWVKYYEQQFMVPRSRIYFTEYSLTQNDDQNAVAATSSIMALGNGRRGLDVIVNALNDISTSLSYAVNHPEVASVNLIHEQSFASSLVKPYVVTSTLDYSDENINVMNESTRLTEMHGRFRARLLEMLALLFAKSLMLNQYKGGERPVIKAWVHSSIADLVIGITDYHPELKDEVAAASGADYSMVLPNGMRLDIVKSNMDCLQGKFFAVPVIESEMDSVLSAAHIVDCGSVSTQYVPTNQGAVVRRIATTTREIVMMTNKVGVCINITGLGYQLGDVGYTPVTLAADYSDSIAI